MGPSAVLPAFFPSGVGKTPLGGKPTVEPVSFACRFDSPYGRTQHGARGFALARNSGFGIGEVQVLKRREYAFRPG